MPPPTYGFLTFRGRGLDLEDLFGSIPSAIRARKSRGRDDDADGKDNHLDRNTLGSSRQDDKDSSRPGVRWLWRPGRRRGKRWLTIFFSCWLGSVGLV
jgi:hypothetical protein